MIFFIFIFALILRFLYFPNNIYFGYDQARDAFATQEIINGQLKLIGPSTTFEGLRHGVLYYYLYAPFYILGKGNPEVVAAFLRIANALGVFIIFIIGRILFNRYIGLISAWLFAISFEQTQFALYFNHPSFAVISTMLMFLGLGLLIFRKQEFGLILALFGLGLSIQFELILTYLIAPFLLNLLIFKKLLPPINLKILTLGLITFLLTISTFIAAEIKYNFRSIFFLQQLLFNETDKSFFKIISTYLFEMGQVIRFNLVSISQLISITGVILLLLFLLSTIIRKNEGGLLTFGNKQTFFLGIWFFSAIVPYIITGGSDLNVDIIQYHPNVGISASLILFTSYLLFIVGKKLHFFIIFVSVFLIFLGNLILIQKINPDGSMPQINAQSFMLISDEKGILDYIYKDAKGEQFAVKAITLPFYINTTWSYLFEWYGQQRYGYLPIWGGKNAIGYPGNLEVEEAQNKLPSKRYLIIEPVRGIPQHLINSYLEEESYFTDLEEERKIGSFIVQKRQAKQ